MKKCSILPTKPYFIMYFIHINNLHKATLGIAYTSIVGLILPDMGNFNTIFNLYALACPMTLISFHLGTYM